MAAQGEVFPKSANGPENPPVTAVDKGAEMFSEEDSWSVRRLYIGARQEKQA
jgi:hypothetical protein